MVGDLCRLFTAGAVVIIVMAIGAGAKAAEFGEFINFENGNSLYAKCTGPALAEVCAGYLEGVSDAMAFGGVSGVTRCVATEVRVSQLRDVVMQYLARHPETRHFAASQLVAYAIAEAFPCK